MGDSARSNAVNSGTPSRNSPQKRETSARFVSGSRGFIGCGLVRIVWSFATCPGNSSSAFTAIAERWYMKYLKASCTGCCRINRGSDPLEAPNDQNGVTSAATWC
jgi:hypothetical protein